MSRLKSTDSSARQEILNAARLRFVHFQDDKDDIVDEDVSVNFEHGQWWVTVNGPDEMKQYSVVDTSNGLDFEEL